MRNKLLTLAGILAITAVLGKFYAVPLVAQVRAALIQNVDEPGRTPYQEEVQTSPTTCDPNFCTAAFNFSPVPAGKRLVIKGLSFVGDTFAGATVLPVGITRGSPLVQGSTPVDPFAEVVIPFTAPPTNPFTFGESCTTTTPCVTWAAQQAVTYFVEAGSVPAVFARVDRNHSVTTIWSATLTGYYVSLP